MQKIGVGLLGYGLAGAAFHAPLIAADPSLDLKAIVSSRAGRIADHHPRADCLATAEELVARPDIDLVVVATPNSLHFPQAKLALEAGKHVVIDKPFALDLAEADALLACARASGRMLTVFHNRRLDNGFLTVRRHIAEGSLGTVYRYEARFDRFRPEIKPGWRERPHSGAGLLADLGPHLIDQALVLFGRPDAVRADIAIQRPEAEVDDYFELVLHYGRRRIILGASTLMRLPGPAFAVHGDAGSLIIHGLDPQEDRLRAGAIPGGPDWGTAGSDQSVQLADRSGTRPVAFEAGDYPAFYRDVAASIRTGASPPVSGTDARLVLAVTQAARESTASGGRLIDL